MSSLYNLTAEMQNLMDAEEVDETAIALVFQDIATKAENVCKFLKVLDGDIDTFKAEEKRLADRRKAMENRRDAVKRYVLENMVALGIPKLAAGTFTICLQDSPEKLVVTDRTLTPARFITIIPETYAHDDAAIKAELKAGKEIPGYSLERGQHIRLR